MRGRVLVVAGSDSGGGAGIQADIKTVTALGGFAATAITALTAQNTRGVHGVVGVEPGFIVDQMRAVLDDIGADCIKTGMLHSIPVIEAVADVLAGLDGIPVVVDPVMVAKGGDLLLEQDAVACLRERLLPLAHVLTPNLIEAGQLVGMDVDDASSMVAAGLCLVDQGARAVIVKGGRLTGERVVDLLVTADGVERAESARLDSTSLHGTGCTFASAIATGLAQGLELRTAFHRARLFVHQAIRGAPGFGSGHGPLDHAHAIPAYHP
ncbi:MAG: bifunctional hydroxymethylpyrimidine kinase/phosphomethylpyrimidine kinase [Gammaproteobacteria bacterium]|nr:bifunctional hydroxymethylpyrimidine kinase/phosphomethylpyrimidine kinase [Gammaproteobacteria bacterium]